MSPMRMLSCLARFTSIGRLGDHRRGRCRAPRPRWCGSSSPRRCPGRALALGLLGDGHQHLVVLVGHAGAVDDERHADGGEHALARSCTASAAPRSPRPDGSCAGVRAMRSAPSSHGLGRPGGRVVRARRPRRPAARATSRRAARRTTSTASAGPVRHGALRSAGRAGCVSPPTVTVLVRGCRRRTLLPEGDLAHRPGHFSDQGSRLRLMCLTPGRRGFRRSDPSSALDAPSLPGRAGAPRRVVADASRRRSCRAGRARPRARRPP